MESTPIRNRALLLLDHLGDLRSGIFISLAAYLAGAVVSFMNSTRIFHVLLKPLQGVLPKFPAVQARMASLGTLTPGEIFFVDLKLTALGALVLSSPVWLWQAWVFLVPILKPRERRLFLGALVLGGLFFAMGVALAYVWLIPPSLEILIRYTLNYYTMPNWTVDYYTTFVSLFLAGMGFSFELPLVMGMLGALGIADHSFFAKKRLWAYLILFLAVGFAPFTSDLTSQLIFFTPLLGLYELGILFNFLAGRNLRKVPGGSTADRGSGPSGENRPGGPG